ncbi:MAG: hypothetical protein CSA33_03085 [Desulfobulbus propionicus]|nr:MAG: hypothetical protein CSA33_03085 [Desulfobulbus propionicus]
MEQLEDFFATITDQKAVRVTLPILDSDEKKRLSCLFVSECQPAFYLAFPPGSLDASSIDQSKKCLLTVDFGGQVVSVVATIEAIEGDQIIKATACEVIRHQQHRNYFRVDAATPVAAKPIETNLDTKQDKAWYLQGETMDLSGSGMLCTFPAPLERDRPLRIRLTLPNNTMDVIDIIGHVVRCRKINDALFHVALHFDTIETDERDKIVGSCLEVQRKQLRMRVQVKDLL